MLRKSVVFAVFVPIVLMACTKPAKADVSLQKAQSGTEAAVSPELRKLYTVLSVMSERAKEAVTISSKKEFLSDLEAVLTAEKKYRSDDLPLYTLIDKKNPVSADYVPKDLVPLVKNDLFSINRNDLSLRPDAYEALKELSAAALSDGIKILVSSTYRSYKYQENLFNYWVSVDGLEEAERESSRPGTSQHQLGSVIDFGSITDDFAETKMGQWIYANASDYGWSLSFPKGYEDVTGYRWECWHFRFIGKEACAFQKKYFSNIQQFMLEFIDIWKSS